jgi:chemotaxis signal transduction protein
MERLLAFDLSRHRWAFRLRDLAGAVEMPALRRVPGVGPPILGLAQRHGRVVTVVDLPALLGDAPEKGPQSLLLLAPPRAHLAFWVRADLRLVVLEPALAPDRLLLRVDLARVVAPLEHGTPGV